MEATKHTRLGSFPAPHGWGFIGWSERFGTSDLNTYRPAMGVPGWESFWVPIAHLMSPGSRVRAQPIPLPAP